MQLGDGGVREPSDKHAPPFYQTGRGGVLTGSSHTRLTSFPGHHDLLDDLLAVEVALDRVGAAGELQELLLGRVRRRLDARPSLPLTWTTSVKVSLSSSAGRPSARLLPDAAPSIAS